MTALNFYLHPAAVDEAEEAARWYRQRSPLAAVRFVAELNLVIDKILEAPRRWPVGIGGTRKVKLPFFPFVVIYVESADQIRVLAIAHGRRRPGYWRRRL
jgi:plasmid stabilization system protein ParE